MVIIFKFDVKFKNLVTSSRFIGMRLNKIYEIFFYLLIFPTLKPNDYGAEIWSSYGRANDQWLLTS